MSRAIVDAKFSNTTAFPAAGASAQSVSFDLGAHGNTNRAILPEHLEMQVTWPLLSALADAKNVVFLVQDSADNSSFATISGGITKTITGAGGIGVAAGSFTFRLPSGTREFVRVQATLDAAGGTITASSFTTQLLF